MKARYDPPEPEPTRIVGRRHSREQQVPVVEPDNTYGEMIFVCWFFLTLSVQRLRADLMLTYKIVFGIIADTDISQFFTVCRNEYNTRGHRFRLLATRANKDTRHYFYSLRVVRVWNSLPDDTDFSSLLGFKKSLYCANLQNFCIVCY